MLGATRTARDGTLRYADILARRRRVVSAVRGKIRYLRNVFGFQVQHPPSRGVDVAIAANMKTSFSFSDIHSIQYPCQRLFLSSTTPSSTKGDDSHDDIDKTVEEEYSRKSPREHVLLRPSMYVGPTATRTLESCWVPESVPPIPPERLRTESLSQLQSSKQHEEQEQAWNVRIMKRECHVSPALVKIFDEILVNASDNRLRHPKTCKRIDVVIDPGNEKRRPLIRVFNNGKGIPVRVHRGENLYIPEMLFGHLLTGSNFDDTIKRITGGLHGYGAKLTNIWSESFTVEVADATTKKLYRQTWTDNMSVMEDPQITPYKTGKDYTCISFVPDLERMRGGPTENDDSSLPHVINGDEYALMCRRVLDVAGVADGKLNVTINGLNVPVPSFGSYLSLYPSTETMVFHNVNARWKVGVGYSEDGFQSVSFVNGVATDLGGTHVNVVTKQILKSLQEAIGKTDQQLSKYVSRDMVLKHLYVAVDALIENPSFDSQTKERLSTKPSDFGSTCELPTMFLNKIVAEREAGGPGLIEEIVVLAKAKQARQLRPKNSTTQITKLDDARQAGGSDARKCTLILTEGDSARALAVAGLEVFGKENVDGQERSVGREWYGVYPLTGKILNVRHASDTQLRTNEVVKHLISALGLHFNKSYRTKAERETLRYGRVMIMTDQDSDGSHIKGLIINFFRHYWPGLLRPLEDGDIEDFPPSFLSAFVTPLLKARKGKETISFYSVVDFNEWKESIGSDFSKWTIKYYKGLGTSTAAEAREYFEAFDRHVRDFQWTSEADEESIDMAFDKERASERRDWIDNMYDESTSIYAGELANKRSVSFQDFVNKDLVHFSHGDNIRSLPSAIDGLKPSQRKVLYACFKRKLKSEVKVSQLSGYCAEQTAYHHGERSLQLTIVNMAQDFVGSNNVNLLLPNGQFGTRLIGGDDAADARYIFTQLAPATRVLFPEADDQLLSYKEDDGQIVEPDFYCPIIPMLLVNGAKGIGTGWSTDVPSFSPSNIVEYIRAKLENHKELPSIHPFIRGFTGRIAKRRTGGYDTIGVVANLSETQVRVEELPVGCWTNVYKDTLNKLREKKVIKSFTDDHSTTDVSFTITMSKASLEQTETVKLEKKLKLVAGMPTTNMHGFDAEGNIVKFEKPEDVVDLFFPLRLRLYEDRRSVLVSEAEYQVMLLRNKARFIRMVTSNEINLRKPRQTIFSRLGEAGLDSAATLDQVRTNNALGNRNPQLCQSRLGGNEEKSFDYLLNMPLSSLTSERVAELEEEAKKRDRQLQKIRGTTEQELWHQDLDKLEPLLPVS